MPKNYVEYNDANAVLGTYANAIKAATPIEITYDQFQQLTPQQQEAGNYIVSNYPGSDTVEKVVKYISDGTKTYSQFYNQFVELVDYLIANKCYDIYFIINHNVSENYAIKLDFQYHDGTMTSFLSKHLNNYLQEQNRCICLTDGNSSYRVLFRNMDGTAASSSKVYTTDTFPSGYFAELHYKC